MKRVSSLSVHGLRPIAIFLVASIAGFARPNDAGLICDIPLLRNAYVRHELKISNAVAKKLDLIEAAYSRKARAVLNSRHGGKLSLDSVRILSAAFHEGKDQSLHLLSRGQKLRLEQISLQSEGASALENPLVARRVGLSASQVSKLNEADKEQLTKMLSDLSKDGNVRTQQVQGRSFVRKLNMEIYAQSVLTPAQWGAWLSLRGRPFRLSSR